jgi:hypothetical protein
MQETNLAIGKNAPGKEEKRADKLSIPSAFKNILLPC